MNVAGDKVLDDEKETQDFVLINHPVFFLPDVQGYIDFSTFQASKAKGLTPDPNLKTKLARSFEILENMNKKKVANPLLIQYWSTTPYKLGSHAIKFSVKPRKPEQPPASTADSPNYLRETMVKYLNDVEESVKFDFQVQFYIDDDKTPVENPMKEWSEIDSTPITVATIEIPQQKFDFEERKRLDENLSFSPWHTLPAHEPLGSVNLSRKKIYQEVVKHRREYIQERLRKPQPYPIYP
jgi:hypothetical protein